MTGAWKKLMRYAGALFLFAVVLEATVFNYRHYESMGMTPPEQVETDYVGLQDNGDGTWTADGQNPYIEFSFPLWEIKNIKLDMETLPGDQYANQVKVSFSFSDEGSQPYYDVPQSALYDYERGEQVETVTAGTVLHHYPWSQYIRLHPGGQVRQIRVWLHVNAGQVIRIHDMAFNVERPFYFSALRLLLVWGLAMAVYLLSPKHGFYDAVYDGNRRQKGIIFLFAAGMILIFFFLIHRVNYSAEPGASPYHALARALARGQVYLDVEPSPELLEMTNPYDTRLRQENQVGFLWDHAFYQGKYYVYFGVMPALIFYLPYYLLTGNDLPVHLDIYIMTILYVAAVFLLLHQLCKKYFPRTSFLVYLLLSSSLIWGGGVLFLVLHPDFYTVPKYYSVVMVILGLYFWLSGRKENDAVSMWRLTAGSFCMASVAGGRTQMLLGSFLAICLLGGLFIKKTWRDTFRRENIKRFLIFFSPFLFIAAILMIYNFQRFGSAFDFGANYNLTTNDMTKRGINLDRCGLALFTCLFQPPYMISQFPYITEVNLVTGYAGITITEGMRGGLLVCNPILLALLFQNNVRDRLKKKGLYWLNLFCLLFGVVIVIADAQLAGILVGYTTDYGIFFFIPAITTILTALESVWQTPHQKVLLKALSFFTLAGIGYNVLTIFVRSNIDSGASLFHQICHVIEFWR